MQSFIIRVKDAQSQNGQVRKLVGNTTIKSFVDLISRCPLDPNPRNAKVNRVTKDIETTLHDENESELFQYMSKGILLAAHDIEILERSRFRVKISDSEKEGILDGGHSTLSIGRFILEKTGYDNCKSVKNWEDLKDHWDIHQKALLDKQASLPNILVPVEILYPAESPTGEQDFKDAILQISAARNNNVQLRETARANKAGLYDELKKHVDSAISDDVEWRENEGGRIKAQDLVALSLIALAALPEEDYPLMSNIKQNPSMLYAQKQQCVRLFNEFMENGITKRDDHGDLVEVVDPRVKSALALIEDLPRLYDLIYKKFPFAYNATSPGFGRIGGVRMFNPEGWKNKKKSAYMRAPAKTKFYQNKVKCSFPDGFMYPIVVSLTELIEVDSNRVFWKTDPYKFIEKNLPLVMKSGFVSIIRSQGYDPQKVGKERGSYELVANLYRVVEHLK